MLHPCHFLSCSWEVLQDHNERPPSFNFSKARWDNFDSHGPSANKYSSLSSAAALFTSLTLNAAKSSIPFGRIKRHPKAWWSAEVEEAVSERRKAFAAAHRSVEDRQSYIPASRRASSVIGKAKAEAWQTTCSSLSLKSNPKSIYFLLRSVASSPNLPNCSSPRESILVFADYLRLHFSVFQPKSLRSRVRGCFSSSAEPRALRSLTHPSFLQLNRRCLQFFLHCHSPRQSCLSHAKASSSMWHEFSSSHLQSLLDFAFLSFHLEDIFYYSHPQDGKASRLSCFLQVYLSHLLRIKAF